MRIERAKDALASNGFGIWETPEALYAIGGKDMGYEVALLPVYFEASATDGFAEAHVPAGMVRHLVRH